MADTFRALLVTKEGDRQSVAVTELTDADLMEGDVTVAVEHSTVNYKDGLAITGKAPIIRKFPLIPGIDLAGRVLRPKEPRFQAGDRVVLNGYGLGEVHHGGYAERARVKGDWLIRLPENISTANAMAIGTAGYTAMLCVLALEKAGITPDRGDVLVTGAAGGVGSVAIALLDKLGYRVVASSRRAEQERDYLRGLGADEIIDAGELSGPGVPLDKERWAGAIDSLGSRTLANVLSQIRLGPGVRPASERPAVHTARRDACGCELGLDPAREARRGLESSGDRPRPRKAQQHDVTGETRRRAGFGGRSPRGKNARTGGHRSLNTDQ
jgi:acrylyl-CoA reductase (NADPH)